MGKKKKHGVQVVFVEIPRKIVPVLPRSCTSVTRTHVHYHWRSYTSVTRTHVQYHWTRHAHMRLPKPGDNNTILFPPFFPEENTGSSQLISLAFLISLHAFYFLICPWISKTKATMLAMSQSTQQRIRILSYASFALRKSTCRQIKSSSFSNPKFNQELCISESLSTRSYRRTTQSSDSVCAFTSHEQGQLGTKTKIRVTHVHIAKMQLK